MLYETYRYIYPPRPSNKIDPKYLNRYDNGEYYAQPKLNGSCGVVFLSGNGPAIVMNRHGEIMTNVKRDQIAFEELHHGTGYMVLTGEVLNKAKNGENNKLFNQKFIIWDIIVFNGEQLIGTTFAQRQKLLSELYKPLKSEFKYIYPIASKTFLKIQGVYMPSLFTEGFSKTFDTLIKVDVYEGIVLKKKNAPLAHGFHSSNNTDWQIKCRKPTKNYKL